jgi:hypothetical protein
MLLYRRCQDTPACQFYTFGPKPASFCWLKRAQKLSGAIFGVQLDDNKYDLTEGVNLNGFNLGRAVPARSVQACKAHCSSKADCKWFVHHNSTCQLKTPWSGALTRLLGTKLSDASIKAAAAAARRARLQQQQQNVVTPAAVPSLDFLSVYVPAKLQADRDAAAAAAAAASAAVATPGGYAMGVISPADDATVTTPGADAMSASSYTPGGYALEDVITPGGYALGVASVTPGGYALSTASITPGGYALGDSSVTPGGYILREASIAPGGYALGDSSVTPGGYALGTASVTRGGYAMAVTPGGYALADAADAEAMELDQFMSEVLDNINNDVPAVQEPEVPAGGCNSEIQLGFSVLNTNCAQMVVRQPGSEFVSANTCSDNHTGFCALRCRHYRRCRCRSSCMCSCSLLSAEPQAGLSHL